MDEEDRWEIFPREDLPHAGRRAPIVELAERVHLVGPNYVPPNSPCTLFALILSRYARVGEDGGLWETYGPGARSMGDTEMELVIGWLNRAWEACDTDNEFQLLYELVVNEREDWDRILHVEVVDGDFEAGT